MSSSLLALAIGYRVAGLMIAIIVAIIRIKLIIAIIVIIVIRNSSNNSNNTSINSNSNSNSSNNNDNNCMRGGLAVLVGGVAGHAGRLKVLDNNSNSEAVKHKVL